MLYESLLLLAYLCVVLLLPHALIAFFTHFLATPLLLQTHVFVALLLYFVGFWRHGQQTLAMKTWHIRLVSRSGRPLSTGQALCRYLLCWPSLGLAGIGVVWALFDQNGQFLHDRLAGTQLILSKADVKPKDKA